MLEGTVQHPRIIIPKKDSAIIVTSSQKCMARVTQFGKLPEAIPWHHVYGIHQPIQTMNESTSFRNLLHLAARRFAVDGPKW
jgi:ribosomal protein L24E